MADVALKALLDPKRARPWWGEGWVVVSEGPRWSGVEGGR